MKILYIGFAVMWFCVAVNIVAEDMKSPINISVATICIITAALLWAVI